MLFEKIKLCIIGVPKNASESIHEAVASQIESERVHDHVPMSHLQIEYGARFMAEYFSVGVRRNPYDRFASAYRYLVANDEWRLSIDETLDYLTAMQTEDVLNIFNDMNPVLHSQSIYLFDGNGSRNIDRILRFEHLSDDWSSLCEYITNTTGVTLRDTLPNLNSKNDGRAWWDVLNTNQLMRLSQIYHDDFINLGYPKGFAIELNESRYKK